MMPHIRYLFILLALPLLTMANGDTDALFKKGNGQYSKAKYKDAIQTYESVLRGGYLSAAVYFNIGNAYYKLGELPPALLYYEKAHKLAPGDEDINFNIRLTTLKTTDKIEPIPQLFLINWWNKVVLGCSAGTWAIWSIVLFLAGSGLLIFYLFTHSANLKKASFFVSIPIIFLGLVGILLASSQANYFSSHRQAIVFSSSVTVKSEPAKASKNLFVIHEGTKVDVLENNNGWTHIRLANGNEGWIPVSYVKNI